MLKLFSWIFIIIVGLITLVVVLNYEKPYENKDLDNYLKNLKKETPKQDTSYLNDRYWKCYGEMTNAHKARGFHQSNREASIKVKEAVCKAYGEGEELNYEGKR